MLARSYVAQLKIILYLISGASEDVETQKKGFVILIWPGTCQSITPSSSGMFESIYNRKHSFDVQMALPVRVVCIHFGNASSPLLRLARIMLVALMHEQSRLRFNLITGEYQRGEMYHAVDKSRRHTGSNGLYTIFTTATLSNRILSSRRFWFLHNVDDYDLFYLYIFV